jgi:hypothetical protein
MAVVIFGARFLPRNLRAHIQRAPSFANAQDLKQDRDPVSNNDIKASPGAAARVRRMNADRRIAAASHPK